MIKRLYVYPELTNEIAIPNRRRGAARDRCTSGTDIARHATSSRMDTRRLREHLGGAAHRRN
jgi:hypothetical protein